MGNKISFSSGKAASKAVKNNVRRKYPKALPSVDPSTGVFKEPELTEQQIRGELTIYLHTHKHTHTHAQTRKGE